MVHLVACLTADPGLTNENPCSVTWLLWRLILKYFHCPLPQIGERRLSLSVHLVFVNPLEGLTYPETVDEVNGRLTDRLDMSLTVFTKP